MKFKLFRKSKFSESKSAREPIVVRIFKENEDNTFISFGSSSNDDQEEELQSAQSPSSSSEHISDNAADISSGSSSKPAGKKEKHLRFIPNQRYYNVSVYAVGVIFAAILLAVFVFNFMDVLSWIKHLLGVLAPFIAGALVSFTLSPIVVALDKGPLEKGLHIKNHKVRLAISVVFTYAVFLGLLSVMMIVLIPQLGTSISDLLGKSKLLYGRVIYFSNNLEEYFPSIDFSIVADKINAAIPNIVNYVSNLLKVSIPKLLNTSYAMVRFVINFLLTIAISIYMVCDRRKIARLGTRITYSLFSPERASSIIRTTKDCGQIFFGFIIGKTIDSIIIGIICFIACSFLKLPYPVLVSVIVGVTNMIPFFGPFIGAIPIICLYLCIDPISALIFAVTIFIIQQFDGWILGPMILGDSTGAGPLWVIFGTTVGGAYFGFVGMLLGVPVTAVIVHLLDLLIQKKLNKKDIDIS